MEYLYEISLNVGIRLAKKYKVDENIVKIAIVMMDSKLPEAAHIGAPKQHISMSLDATKEILKGILSEHEKENIIKCVE